MMIVVVVVVMCVVNKASHSEQTSD
jgi:hypothetical protein